VCVFVSYKTVGHMLRSDCFLVLVHICARIWRKSVCVYVCVCVYLFLRSTQFLSYETDPRAFLSSWVIVCIVVCCVRVGMNVCVYLCMYLCASLFLVCV
jgi:hypothetical protein